MNRGLFFNLAVDGYEQIALIDIILPAILSQNKIVA